MSDDIPDDRDESPDDNDRDAENPAAGPDFGAEDRTDDDEHWLSSLLSALDSLEGGSTSTSGRRRSDRTIFDYDISIRTADDGLADDAGADRNSLGDRPDDRDRDRGRPRKRRRRSSGPSSDHHVTTRSDEDELLVTADIAGTDPDDVTVGFDDGTLVVAVQGRELERVEVPWRQRTAAATIKNGVLTVRIEPDSTAAVESDAEGPDETGGDE